MNNIARVLLSPSSFSVTRWYPRLGAPDYFELSKIVEDLTGLNIYLEEKNLHPAEYQDQKLRFKGRAPPASSQKYTFMISQFVISVLRYALSVDAGKLKTQDRLLAEIGM